MEAQVNKLKPLYNNSPVNAGDYFIHIKTENLYKVIEARDNLIKLNGKWSPGVIYTRDDIESQMYVRTFDDFRNHFSLAHGFTDEEVVQV
jgi:hypothetical protein